MARTSDKIALLSVEAAWGGGTDKHMAPKGRIWLARVGGLSPVNQGSAPTPEPRGIWCFLWPYIEPFLIGSTDDRGSVSVRDGEGNVIKTRPSRYELMKRRSMPLKKFQYEGWLWTRWDEAARYSHIKSNGWYLVDAGTMSMLVKKFAHQIQGEAIEHTMQTVQTVGGPLRYNKDAMEVFIPATGGKIVGKPAREPRVDEDFGEDP